MQQAELTDERQDVRVALRHHKVVDVEHLAAERAHRALCLVLNQRRSSWKREVVDVELLAAGGHTGGLCVALTNRAGTQGGRVWH